MQKEIFIQFCKMLVSINIQDVQDMSPHCPRHIPDTSGMYQVSRGYLLGLIMMSATCPHCPHIVEDVSQTHPRQSCLQPTLCQDVLTLSQWRLVQGKKNLPTCSQHVPDTTKTCIICIFVLSYHLGLCRHPKDCDVLDVLATSWQNVLACLVCVRQALDSWVWTACLSHLVRWVLKGDSTC